MPSLSSLPTDICSKWSTLRKLSRREALQLVSGEKTVLFSVRWQRNCHCCSHSFLGRCWEESRGQAAGGPDGEEDLLPGWPRPHGLRRPHRGRSGADQAGQGGVPEPQAHRGGSRHPGVHHQVGYMIQAHITIYQGVNNNCLFKARGQPQAEIHTEQWQKTVRYLLPHYW